MELSVNAFHSDDIADTTHDMVARRPVDLVHLARYTLGNRALEREVLSLFRTQSLLYLTRLKLADTDREWHDAAHTIKGSARGIGAWIVADAAERAEDLRGKAQPDARDASLSVLEDRVAETNAFIGVLLSED